jgi:hypothetical protein
MRHRSDLARLYMGTDQRSWPITRRALVEDAQPLPGQTSRRGPSSRGDIARDPNPRLGLLDVPANLHQEKLITTVTRTCWSTDTGIVGLKSVSVKAAVPSTTLPGQLSGATELSQYSYLVATPAKMPSLCAVRVPVRVRLTPVE